MHVRMAGGMQALLAKCFDLGVVDRLERTKRRGEQVVVGRGNDGGDGTEGIVNGRVVGTYLHGPVLARNPALADHLLASVLGPLDPIEDPEVEALRKERLHAARHPHMHMPQLSGWRRLLRGR